MTKADQTPNRQWRSLDELAQTPEFVERVQREFPDAVQDLEIPPVDRRHFLGLMGASMALAGVALPGCVRKPKQKIIPFARRPEDLIPGKPRYYATALQTGHEVVGLIVESQDGRPTKVEGNPKHPMNAGAANAWAQASVAALYDVDRATEPTLDGQPIGTEQLEARLAEIREAAKRDGGKGLALLVEQNCSPTYRALLHRMREIFPAAGIYREDIAFSGNSRAGAEMVGLTGARPHYALERAKVILALDADFLATEGDTLSHARRFNQRRSVVSNRDEMNRLYVVEPCFTVTGMAADHRLRLPASKVGDFLAEVVASLARSGVNPPAGTAPLIARLKTLDALAGDPDERKPSSEKWAEVVARDLLAHRKESLVIIGERQPPRVHALAWLLNQMLDNVGRTVELLAEPETLQIGDLAELSRAMNSGQVKTLVMLGSNPVYSAGADLDFAAGLSRVDRTIHLSDHRDETSERVQLHIPRCHYLETWGDLEASDGTLSIQQPLIAPLYRSLSEIEILARLVGQPKVSGYDLVREHWEKAIANGPQGDIIWRRALHDGRQLRRPPRAEPRFDWSRLASGWTKPTPWPSVERLELTYQVDWSVLDGRYAHIPWLQEAPDPVTKLTWDNALMIGPGTAKKLGLDGWEMVRLTVGQRQINVAVWVVPGVATGSLILPLGYGRTAGPRTARGVGFNANLVRTSDRWSWAEEVTVERVRGLYELASTQDYGSLKPATEEAYGVPQAPSFGPRPIVRQATLAQYREDPKFVEKQEVIAPDKIKSLFVEPNKRDGQQWGMSIDLNSCTGCNACLVACQAENNIPVVGKERVLNGREMHWIRLDRYFTGDDPDDPQVVVQPLGCQQCENAPCETVCPVAATVHSDDGLNDMVYNRCIGTRYCSNNCPFKVRRFNYFNFQKEADQHNPLVALQRNPDVTVRFRGVMEKCTYCVQRIREAGIAYKREGRENVPDGAIVPACAQTCPTQAIVFGDVNDPNSQVSRRKLLDRNYALLAELNVKPRTTYLAKLRNPNPDLV